MTEEPADQAPEEPSPAVGTEGPMLERKSDPTNKRSGSNGIHCGRTAVIHPVHGYNHMRYDFALTHARTQGTAINLHGVHPSGGIPLDGGHGFKIMTHKQGQRSVPRFRSVWRARQGERLAFALANALAKRDINHCAPTSALKEVVVTGVTTVVSLAPASKARGASRVCVS